VVDAINPGGSGDPYAGLDDEERAALREASLFGYPLRAWYNHETLNSGYLSPTAVSARRADPTYADDFWSKPGYLGADPTDSIHEARVSFETTVARVIDGPVRQIELAEQPEKDFADADLIVLSGAAAGATLPLGPVGGNPVALSSYGDREAAAALAPGDHVRIDNSWALAFQTYQRHQVPPARDVYGWDQFRDAAGEPIYPQRPVLVGLMGSAGAAGSIPCGRIRARTLVLQALMDIDALPWQADWYRSQVQAQLGAAFDDSFALWFIDHAQHDNPLTLQAHAHTVSFGGALQQGLRDLAAWVEQGIKPSETRYRVEDTQVIVPDSAAERGGIQPVPALQANGAVRAEVRAGETVAFTASIAVPAGAGKVVAAEWDFEGSGTYPVPQDIGSPEASKDLAVTHAFARPGTYFPVLRVTSQREGDAATPYARIQNIARVRVVVE
jgi:hypothetical protein